MWYFRVADLGRATQTWKWQKLPEFDPDNSNFYGEVGVTGHMGAVSLEENGTLRERGGGPGSLNCQNG